MTIEQERLLSIIEFAQQSARLAAKPAATLAHCCIGGGPHAFKPGASGNPLLYLTRKIDSEATRLSKILNLASGASVAEIGAGKGKMTVRVARQVQPGGRVLSTEFEPKKVRKISHSVQKSGMTNVAVVQGSETGAELPSESCDAIFMRGVYHHFTAPQEMNRSLFRALRPGGTLAVIDFPPKWLLSLWTPKGIPENRGGHGIRKELLIEELTQVGFRGMAEYDTWDSNRYCVVFRKRAN